MTWVKICGITNLEDALTAVEAGADALGFVFYEKSPRRVNPDLIREIVRKLPESVEKVGVFVEEPPDKIRQIVKQSGLTAVQCYAEQAKASKIHNEVCANIGQDALKLIIARRVPDRDDGWFLAIGDARDLRVTYALLIDSSSATAPGGTGNRFDWVQARPWLRGMKTRIRTIVAGGLDPDNVSVAMNLCQPWGVDVSTGVEASKGKKDPQKVRAFIAAVRREDARH